MVMIDGFEQKWIVVHKMYKVFQEYPNSFKFVESLFIK